MLLSVENFGNMASTPLLITNKPPEVRLEKQTKQ